MVAEPHTDDANTPTPPPPADDGATPPADANTGQSQQDQQIPESLIDGNAIPAEERNEYLLARILIHPFAEMDERVFLELLQNSLSLNLFEKKRVIDAVPTLSQYQVDELIKVFEDERVEFRKLMPTEGETIKQYVTKARKEWIQLYELYKTEEIQREQEVREQQKIDDIKKGLGL